mmetsp:Transcript_79849/g.158680  ORF Transcript_79849/g.158680 Transcript_79849/m.158680 type:complete len:417 (+) Transcript_79849:691-1941(+)
MLFEDALNGELVLGLDVAENDGLGGRQDHREVVTVDEQPQAGLDTKLGRVADASLLDVDAEHHLAVALLMPAHPVQIFPLGQGGPGLDLLAVVLLDESAEAVDAEGVNEVLEASRRTHLAVAMITLDSEDSLHRLEKVLLLYESQMVRSAGKGCLLPMGPAHTTTHNNVEPFESHAVRLHDDDAANVVDVQVDRVVPGHRECDLELLWQVGASIERLYWMACDDAIAIVEVTHLVKIELTNVPLPVFYLLSFLAIEPKLVEAFGHRLEEISNGSRVLHAIRVRGVVGKVDGRRHDVAVNVAAAAVGIRAHVGDVGDDLLELRLDDAMQLEGLTGRSAQVALAILVGKVVELTEERSRHLSNRDLEAQHELVRLLAIGLLLQVTVLLHVRAMVLEDVDRILGHKDLVVRHVVLQRLK